MRSTFLPRDAARLFAGIPARWWVAGGWAIDLWLGRQTRDHIDLDIAILRDEQSIVRARLVAWDLHLAHDGDLTPLATSDRVDPPLHAVWCRPSVSDAWAFELLMNDSSREEWLFRRDHDVRRPLAAIGRVNDEEIPFLSPEIVLLFKAKNRRDVDETDLENTLPTLDGPRRLWLADALHRVHPSHEWIERLEDG